MSPVVDATSAVVEDSAGAVRLKIRQFGFDDDEVGEPVGPRLSLSCSSELRRRASARASCLGVGPTYLYNDFVCPGPRQLGHWAFLTRLKKKTQ